MLKITNLSLNDGFGAQYRLAIIALFYAEFNSLDFVYTPFEKMEHNYDNSPDFLEKKEKLIGFIHEFEVDKEGTTRRYYEKYNIWPVIENQLTFFANNIHHFENGETHKKIRRLFFSDKLKKDYYSDDFFNVAIHIRRLNSHDTLSIEPSFISNSSYVQLISEMRKKYSKGGREKLLFHIFSQGDNVNFSEFENDESIIFHLDTSLESTFISLVMADCLVTSLSTLSYVAGLLSDGEVFYFKKMKNGKYEDNKWYQPMKKWKQVME